MARKKKKTVAKNLVTASAVTVAEAENSCRCENDLQKYWCEVSVKVGKQRYCVEREEAFENLKEEAASVAVVKGAATTTEERWGLKIRTTVDAVTTCKSSGVMSS